MIMITRECEYGLLFIYFFKCVCVCVGDGWVYRSVNNFKKDPTMDGYCLVLCYVTVVQVLSYNI